MYDRFNRLTAEQLVQLPVFVFGTLRPGQGNDRTYEGVAWAEHDGTARLADHRLVSNGAFPYCIPAPGETTTGCLIVTDEKHWPHAREAMDALEGVPVHYDRVRCVVEVDGYRQVDAWYYVPTDWEGYAHLTPVPGNDWANHERRTSRWWQEFA